MNSKQNRVYLTETKNIEKRNITQDPALVLEETQTEISMKITIDLANILDKNCPLRTLEMAFQSIKILKLSGGPCPYTRPNESNLQRSRDFPIYLLKRLDSLASKGTK